MRVRRVDGLLIERMATEAVVIVPGCDEAYLLSGDALRVFDAEQAMTGLDEAELQRLVDLGIVEPIGVGRRKLVAAAALAPIAVIALSGREAAASVITPPPPSGPSLTLALQNPTCTNYGSGFIGETADVVITGAGFTPGATVAVVYNTFATSGNAFGRTITASSAGGFSYTENGANRCNFQGSGWSATATNTGNPSETANGSTPDVC